MQRFLAFGLVILAPLTASASTRMVVTATHDGVPVTNAEVCFYAAQIANPLYALENPEVHCLPANSVLEVPPRNLGYYVRQGDRLVARNHDFVTGAVDGDVFRRVKAELHVGGHLSLSRPLRSGEQFAVIIGEGQDNHGMVAGLPLEGQRALVPADVPLVPVLLRDRKPVWVAPRVQVSPGGEHRLVIERTPESSVIVSFAGEDPFASEPEASSCILPYSSRFLNLLREQEVPLVDLVDGRGDVHTPEMRVLRTPNIFDNLYVFRSIRAGSAKLRVSGTRFISTDASIQVGSEQIVVAPEAGRIVLGGAVAVHLTRIGADVNPSPKDCRADSERDEPRRELVLRTCPPLDGILLSPAVLPRCVETHRREVTDTGGTFDLGPIPAGDFLVTMERAGAITKIVRGRSAIGETAMVAVDDDEIFISGMVTRDARPVQAQVRFLTGEAVSDADTGEYTVLVSDLPGQNPVQLVACDDSWMYVHFPTADVPGGAGYDIAIPENAIAITVRDSVTGQPIEDVKLFAHASPPGESKRGGGQVLAYPEEDHFVVSHLDKGTQLRLCASHKNYKRACKDEVVGDDRQQVTISLERNAYRGRVAASGYSRIAFVRPDGTVSEQVTVDARGEFTYTMPWNDGHAVLTGTGPLFAVAGKTLTHGDLVITPPLPAATKTLRFSLASAHPQEKAILGVWLNGLRVPVSVLGTHQIARWQEWFVTRTRPMIVPDLFANDVVSVIPGPDVDLLPPGGLDNPMIFAGQTPVVVRGLEFVIQ